jgi:hydroxyquinol 1,2-dioxygenase
VACSLKSRHGYRGNARDVINNRFPSGASEQTVLGPFYWKGAPKLPMESDLAIDLLGEPCFHSESLLDINGNSIKDASLDIWSGDGDGNYDMQLNSTTMRTRGLLTTGTDGRHSFRSIKPFYYPVPTDVPVGTMLEAIGRHPNRPGHMHFILSAPGCKILVTHLFPSDSFYLDSDAVFGVKESLIVDFHRWDTSIAPKGEKIDTPFWTCEYNFHLAPET